MRERDSLKRERALKFLIVNFFLFCKTNSFKSNVLYNKKNVKIKTRKSVWLKTNEQKKKCVHLIIPRSY